MSSTTKSPAWSHLNTMLSQLIELLAQYPTMEMKSDEEREHPTHPDNIQFMWIFCKDTKRKLLKVPPDLPYSKEKEWDEVVERCEWIDGKINDEKELDAITGQYPGQTQFRNEEKQCARLLAIGLQENLVD